MKTDRRDAKKLVTLFRGGMLSYVAPPSAETEGLRDLLRCRDDVRRARQKARQQILQQLLRHGVVYRDGKHAWTKTHKQWLRRQRLDDPLAQLALEQALTHMEMIDTHLVALDQRLEEIAGDERWATPVSKLTAFRGISTLTALGLIAEIGDFNRFQSPRELAAWLGLVPTEYSSGQSRHQGHITKTGNKHARRLLTEAAWHYRHTPRRPASGPAPSPRAWQAQIRLHDRYRHLTQDNGKRSTVAITAIARELAGFLWAQMTEQPPRPDREPSPPRELITA